MEKEKEEWGFEIQIDLYCRLFSILSFKTDVFIFLSLRYIYAVKRTETVNASFNNI